MPLTCTKRPFLPTVSEWRVIRTEGREPTFLERTAMPTTEDVGKTLELRPFFTRCRNCHRLLVP